MNWSAIKTSMIKICKGGNFRPAWCRPDHQQLLLFELMWSTLIRGINYIPVLVQILSRTPVTLAVWVDETFEWNSDVNIGYYNCYKYIHAATPRSPYTKSTVQLYSIATWGILKDCYNIISYLFVVSPACHFSSINVFSGVFYSLFFSSFVVSPPYFWDQRWPPTNLEPRPKMAVK